MTRKERQTAKAQAEVNAFNAKYPVGTRVRYWTWTREGVGAEGVTRHAATVLSGHTAVAWVTGHAACVALTHVEVL